MDAKENRRKSIFVDIEKWDYLFQVEDDSQIRILHCVTPRDGGYGTPVNFCVSRDYIETHTAKELYNKICTMHMSPSMDIDTEAEIKQLKEVLTYFGFPPKD